MQAKFDKIDRVDTSISEIETMVDDFDYLNEELESITPQTTPQELKAILQGPSKSISALRAFATARVGGN